ncbi:MAG: tetratricopeptide repeat protein, partial [Candidatus Acidiferrum sp.]
QGKYDEAIAALTALHSQTPAPKGLDHELGVAYYKKGDYPNAVRSLQAAQKEEPNDGEIIQLTGLTLYLAGKPSDAIPFLEKVQKPGICARISTLPISWASPTYKPKKYSEGRAAFAKMFGVPPDSAAAYLFAARMLLRLDFDPIAEEYGLKAVSLDPKLPLAHQLLGQAYRDLGRSEDAERELKLAEQLQGRDVSRQQ